MKFILKNYYNIEKYENESKNIRDKKLSLKGIKSNISLPEIINDLNSSDLLNVKSKAEISIIFEDFTWFGKIKNKFGEYASLAALKATNFHWPL